MRFAGTWKRVLRQRDQPTDEDRRSERLSLYLRWPYQATVMKVFDAISSRTTVSVVFISE